MIYRQVQTATHKTQELRAAELYPKGISQSSLCFSSTYTQLAIERACWCTICQPPACHVLRVQHFSAFIFMGLSPSKNEWNK